MRTRRWWPDRPCDRQARGYRPMTSTSLTRAANPAPPSVSALPVDPRKRVQPSDYWMRSVSFAGLHRMLAAVAAVPDGLTAREINDFVLMKGLTLTQKNPHPARATLYHYRNTLLKLGALKRVGRRLLANRENPVVREILRLPVPPNCVSSLDPVAREKFVGLVLKNKQCRALFFNLFLSCNNESVTATHFRRFGTSVEWWHEEYEGTLTEAVLCGKNTERVVRCASPASKNAVMYGLRYWARNELKLIDEYSAPGGRRFTMFPLVEPWDSLASKDSAVMDMVRNVLAFRTLADWTEFSVYDLVVRCCEAHRKPMTLLFAAIDWLFRVWPYHTYPVPTSPALATLNTTSHFRENLELRRLYRGSRGTYVSHFRVHKDVNLTH